MTRVLLVFAVSLAFFAPGIVAENNVCIFAAKEARGVNTHIKDDVQSLADVLTGNDKVSLLPVSVSGVDPSQIGAEAQRRNCSYIVTLWRQERSPASPIFAGSLAGAETASSPDAVLDYGGSRSHTLLNYSLRKTGSHKALANGYADASNPYDKIAQQIAKKIGGGK